MFEGVLLYGAAVWGLMVCIGIYLLAGLLLVAIMHKTIAPEKIQNQLGGRGWKPVCKAALYGAPLPICSCGVIPLATSLRKAGAGKGAVTSFFITTPMTGADSILLTYGVFGWPMTVLRVIGSLISGIAAGVWVEKSEQIGNEKSELETHGGCSSGCGCHHHHNEQSTQSGWRDSLRYAFEEVFADVARPMLIGLLLSALLVLAVPADLARLMRDSLWIGYGIAIIAALPVYACSVSVIPFGFVLMIMGVSPGAVFLFLSLAPGTNLITAGVYKQLMGMRALLIYVTVIVTVSLIIALSIDFLWDESLFYPRQSIEEENYYWFEKLAGGAALLLMMFYSMPERWRRRVA